MEHFPDDEPPGGGGGNEGDVDAGIGGIAEEETDGALYPYDYLDEPSSRPSSRASSAGGGRVSPSVLQDLAGDMDNVAWGELPVERVYEYFAQATSLGSIARAFEELKTKLGVKDDLIGLELYRALREKLSTQKTWKARDVFQMLEKRANQQEYMGQKAAEGVRVLIVGGGPVGLRLAVDCLLLGCDVRVIEKRPTFSRNNVLHLWPFTIEDLRQLGAKKFHGKFCAGAIDHICIRSLQCILLKISLLLGVSFHAGVEFLQVLEPNQETGWHAKLNPSDHFLNQFEFDILVGADGRRSTVPGFDRKELRGKLALAITANFNNYFTREEAAVDEISGVAFIFNQKFFKDLKADTGIDLENIVYYKDDTHYFVMTAKKDSLLKKGVLVADHSDTRDLLHPSNINKDELYDYAVDAAGWSTELPQLDFALNHYDEPDVALFDFTSIFQAEYAARAVKRRGKDLILCVAGDALLEPFWPTGTGLARGFLSAQDTAWMIRGLGQGRKMQELLCEREVISRQLPQTTPEKLQNNIKTYTINPFTRYCNLQLRRLPVQSVKHLYDTDTIGTSPALQRGSFKMKSSSSSSATGASSNKENRGPSSLSAPRTPSPISLSPSRRPLAEGSVNLAYYSEPANKMSLANPSALLQWANTHLQGYGLRVYDLTTSWSDGLALCALIHRFHPELIPEYSQLTAADPILNNRRAFSVAEESFGISALLQPEEMRTPDKITLFTYLSLFHEFFADTEPVAPPPGRSDKMAVPQKVTPTKRKVAVMYAPTPQSVERSWNTQTVKRQSLSPPPTVSTATASLSNGRHDDGNRDNDPSEVELPKKKVYSQPKPVKRSGFVPPTMATNSSDICHFCGKKVYLMERMSANGFFFHRTCFRCSHCNCQLKIGGYSLSKGEKSGDKGKFFCTPHYRQLFLSNPEAINYSRAGQGRRERAGQDKEEPMEVVQSSAVGVGPAEPVIPVLKLDKLVEETEEEEGKVAVGAGLVLVPSSPIVIIEPPTVEEEEKERKKSRKWTFSSKKSKEQTEKVAEGAKEGGAGTTGEVKGEVKSEEEEVRGMSEEREKKGLERGEKKGERAMGEVYECGERESDGRKVSEEKMEEEAKGEQEEREREGVRRERRSLCEMERHRWSTLTETESIAIRQENESFENGKIENGVLEKVEEGKREGNESEVFNGLLVKERGRGRTWGRGTEREREEREIVMEIERSTLQITTCHHGGVAFKKRPRAPSHVLKLTATYEMKERDKEETLTRSSRLVNRNKYRARGGQKSIVRPMRVAGASLDNTDVMIQERRKQQKRFREAQSTQREMSQLERQYEEMEDYGREIEQQLRDVEGTEQEEKFMQKWLQLVNERNGLVRKITEFSLRYKELELEDRQYEVDKELNELFTIPEEKQTAMEKERFEELFQSKIALVEERDELVIQIEEERKREQEEDASTQNVFEGYRDYRRSSVASRASAFEEYSNSPNSMRRISSSPNVRYRKESDAIAEEVFNEGAEQVEKVLLKDNRRKSRLKSWLGYSK